MAEQILCYSFLPADGVERIIRLRRRVRVRLAENAEVVGTDEAFFEDDADDQGIQDLYTEKAGILDGDVDAEVDLASYAYQIWKNAITDNPRLKKIITDLPPVVYATRPLLTGQVYAEVAGRLSELIDDVHEVRVFVHRDAERMSREERACEIRQALAKIVHPPVVCVVPVRMTEAWLLFDEMAIRKAVGNPTSNQPLELPVINDIESLPDPKKILHDLLRCQRPCQ